eukprot:364639-Chlamydomonas_euryale.AAC.61
MHPVDPPSPCLAHLPDHAWEPAASQQTAPASQQSASQQTARPRPTPATRQLGPHKLGRLLVAEYVRSAEASGRQAPEGEAGHFNVCWGHDVTDADAKAIRQGARIDGGKRRWEIEKPTDNTATRQMAPALHAQFFCLLFWASISCCYIASTPGGGGGAAAREHHPMAMQCQTPVAASAMPKLSFNAIGKPRQLHPSKAEVTVMIGWLQHEKNRLHFSSMAVAALKDKEKGLRVVKKAKNLNDPDGPDDDDNETIKSGILSAFWWDFEDDHEQVLEAMSAPRKLRISPS